MHQHIEFNSRMLKKIIKICSFTAVVSEFNECWRRQRRQETSTNADGVFEFPRKLSRVSRIKYKDLIAPAHNNDCPDSDEMND